MPTKKLAAPDWREDVDKWLDTLKAGARSSETIKTRKRQLVTLSNAIGVSPGEVTGEQLVSWFASRDWKPETRKGYRNAVHSFFSWMLATGRRDDDPSDALPSVKRPQPHPRPCPDRIIMRALAKADESEIVMLRLGAECGLRSHEICRVHSDDVMHDLIGYSLIVRGKGDKQRLVPLPDDLAETITKANGYMFPGRFAPHCEVTYVGKHLATLLGDGWTAHSLRHRYATTTYAATHDLYLVSKLLGHASVETTQRYVALPDERLRAALAAVTLAG